MGLVIWDFDGPIIDSRQARDRAFERLLEAYPAIAPSALLLRATPLYDPRRLLQVAFSEYDLDPGLLNDMEGSLRTLLKEEEEKLDLRGEVEFVIRKLFQRDRPQAILSLRSEDSIKRFLDRWRITPSFSAVVGRDSGHALKPDPEAVLRLIKLTNSDLKQAIFVGDSDVDIETANRSGVTYIHAGWSSEPVVGLKQGSTIIASTPTDILRYALDGFEKLPDTSEARGQLRQCVAGRPFSYFAGAGVSIESGIGAWKDTYLGILRAFLSESALARMSLPEAVQLICASNADADALFHEFKQLFSQHYPPSPYHYAMVRSSCSAIWTTNYDNLFEVAKSTSMIALEEIRDDDDLKRNFGTGRKLLKVNGDFQSGRFDRGSMDWKLVMSDEQFDISETERQELWRYFEDEFRTSSLVFVGVSFNDPTLKRVLSIVSRRIMRPRHPHFVLVLAPTHLEERMILRRQIDLLRRRGLYTVLFNTFDEIRDFVCELGVRSRKPAIGFSGRTHAVDKSGNDAVPNVRSQALEGGVLTIGEVEAHAGRLGAICSENGFRVISGHGVGVGIPAVEEAHRIDRRSARFVLRKRGETATSRGAPVITVGTTFEEPRRVLIDASLILVSMGGTVTADGKSGTIDEARMSLEAGRPILMFPQAGGAIHKRHAELMSLIERSLEGNVLRRCIEMNKRIAEVPNSSLHRFCEEEFGAQVHHLAQTLLTSPTSQVFDRSCAQADKLWTEI